MKNKKIQRRYVTLVEMMIVMFLIAMIIGVIAYNYTGSLDEGKAFKSKTGMDKIHTVLDLYLAAHPEERDHIDTRWKTILESSQLVKNAKDLEKDGWGSEYKVSIDGSTSDIVIESEKYNDYLSKKGQGSLFNK